MEKNLATLESLTAAGRMLHNVDNVSWAHRDFGEWVEDVGQWLEAGYPGTGLSAEWSGLPRSELIVGNHYDPSDEGRVYFDKVVGARLKWLGQVGQRLSAARSAERIGTKESDALFESITDTIARSFLPERFKSIIRADIFDAQKSYHAESFKSCVVMLGGALEGVMLGTLQRSDVITYLATSHAIPKLIKKLGNGDPNLSDKIADLLTFADYKVCIHELIPGSDDLGIDNIQDFRNAIHPWKAVQEPLKFLVFDRSRALHFLASFQKIIEAICPWRP